MIYQPLPRSQLQVVMLGSNIFRMLCGTIHKSFSHYAFRLKNWESGCSHIQSHRLLKLSHEQETDSGYVKYNRNIKIYA